MQAYLSAVDGRLKNTFIEAVYCVMADKQAHEPFNRLFGKVFAPMQLVMAFERLDKVAGAHVKDARDAFAALIELLKADGWNDEGVTLTWLMIEYDQAMSDAQEVRSKLCADAYAQVQARIVPPPDAAPRVEHLNDSQSQLMEENTVQKGTETLAPEFHTIRVMTSPML